MKTVTLLVKQTEIAHAFPDGFRLALDDTASVLDAIAVADIEIISKCKMFPVKRRKSLLQMVYHKAEDRFYKQVGIQGYTSTNPFLNLRENTKMPLPDGVNVILVPEGGCTTDWEEPAE